MTIYDTFVFINSDNLNGIERLYGKLPIAKLTKVINRHLSVAISEIEQGASRQRNEMAMIKLDKECPDRREIDFEDK